MSDTSEAVKRYLEQGGTVTKLAPSERGRKRGWDRPFRQYGVGSGERLTRPLPEDNYDGSRNKPPRRRRAKP